MQPKQNLEKSKHKFVLIVGTSLIAVIILGLGTILILKHTPSPSAPTLHVESKAEIQSRAKAAFVAGQTALGKGDFTLAKSNFQLADTLYIKSADISHRTQIDSILKGIENQEKTTRKPVEATPIQAPTH